MSKRIKDLLKKEKKQFTDDIINKSLPDASKIPGRVADISLSNIRPNSWNPQRMNNKEFEMLMESMRSGMISTIQVVPIENDPQKCDYMILGGEHRWRAAMELGWKTIPCIVLTDDKFQDRDMQKFLTLKMNTISGNINPERFIELYEEMAERYSRDSLRALFGFANENVFDKLVGDVKDSLKASGLPSDMVQEFSDVVEEVQSADDVSNVLHNLFAKYGDTLDHNYMIFTQGGKQHIYVKCDSLMYDKIHALAVMCSEANVGLSSVLNDNLPAPQTLDLAQYIDDDQDMVFDEDSFDDEDFIEV